MQLLYYTYIISKWDPNELGKVLIRRTKDFGAIFNKIICYTNPNADGLDLGVIF